MLAEELLAEYARKAPVPVMLRGILENVLAPSRLNAIFEHEAQKQYTRELTFAMIVDLMCRVVTRVHPSPHAAYRERAAELPDGNALHWELAGERRSLGRTERGSVYEQAVRLSNEQGQEMLIRRITIELDQPTRDGETELHLLTNLPAEAAEGLPLARLYLVRWRIETAFADLTVPLCCEIKSLGSPPAAIFAFATAVVCYNAIQVPQAAIAAAREPPPTPAPAATTTAVSAPAATPAVNVPVRSIRDELSMYYIAHEVSSLWRGIDLLSPQRLWDDQFAALTSHDLAARLRTLAANVHLPALRKRPPSQRPPKRTSPSKPGSHVSTAKILAGIPPKPK